MIGAQSEREREDERKKKTNKQINRLEKQRQSSEQYVKEGQRIHQII